MSALAVDHVGSRREAVSRRRSSVPRGPRYSKSTTAPTPAPLGLDVSVPCGATPRMQAEKPSSTIAMPDTHHVELRLRTRLGRNALRPSQVPTPPPPNVPTAPRRSLGTKVQLHSTMTQSDPQARRPAGCTDSTPSTFPMGSRTIAVSHHRNRGPRGPHRSGSATAPQPVTCGSAVDVTASAYTRHTASPSGQVLV